MMTWNNMQVFLGLKVQLPIEDDPEGIARAYGGKGVCGR